jgi:3-oxoacyl-[acyl-carrier protein] reductase
VKLQNKIAIITGAASGFGEATARLYAENGAKVAIADLAAEKAEAVARSIGEDKAIAVRTDVSSRADIDNLVAEVTRRFGTPDIIVNNAGYTHRNRPLMEVDEATFDRLFAVNVKSVYHMVQAAAPAMRDNGGGVILNVGSTAGIRPRPGLTFYNASKGAVNLMSKSLAVELAPWKIRVNAICPVMGVTGMLEDFMGVPDTPDNRAKFIATIPLGRLSEGRDVAEAALYLAAADFITGVELPVDGGRTV